MSDRIIIGRNGKLMLETGSACANVHSAAKREDARRLGAVKDGKMVRQEKVQCYSMQRCKLQWWYEKDWCKCME